MARWTISGMRRHALASIANVGYEEWRSPGPAEPTTNEALDPWSPLVAYVGNRGDVIGTGSHHGEAPWHGAGRSCRTRVLREQTSL